MLSYLFHWLFFSSRAGDISLWSESNTWRRETWMETHGEEEGDMHTHKVKQLSHPESSQAYHTWDNKTCQGPLILV